MKAAVYNQKGESKGEVELPDSVFGLKWNADLVHQVLVAFNANQRSGTAHAKGRGEVSGGGRKPWRQKGTGRARHGSIRSPIWIGGGVTHGPVKEKKYAQKVNVKMKRKAILTALSKKLSDKEILFVDGISFDDAKTKEAQLLLKSLGAVKGFEKLGMPGGKALLVLPSSDPKIVRAIRNLSFADSSEARNLNIMSLFAFKYLIVPKASVDIIANTFAK